MENSMEVPKKIKIELPYDPAIPLLGIYPEKTIIQKGSCGTSLVVQWLRIRLPVQETWLWALVREDPTCCGAPEPQLLSLCSRAHEPQLLSPCATTTEACVSRARALQWEATAMRSLCTANKSSPRSPQLEKSPCATTKTQCSQK